MKASEERVLEVVKAIDVLLQQPTAAAATIGHLIDGELRVTTAPVQPIFNPATGRTVRHVEMAGRDTAHAAIAAAAAAFPAWRATPPTQRARIMFRFKELIEQHAQRICRLVTEEHGKVLEDSMGELRRAIEYVEFACYAPEMLKGEHTRNVSPGIDSWSEFQPLGVVAGITPFNFPAMVPLWMYPTAIAAGNTFVLKPSEKNPSAVLYVAQLLTEAGLPKGVLNVVNGNKEAVDALLTDPRVLAVSFVGSTPVAESIYRTASAHGKRVQALGGAKNHAVVMPDADIDAAVRALIGAAYGSCGERCMAIPVVVAVGDAIGDAVVAGVRAELARMRVGDGSVQGVEMGPLITRDHCSRVRRYVDLGVAEGAELVVDGRDVVVPGDEAGYYLGGCLFDRVQPHMKIYKDEIFGPVLSVMRVETLEQAIGLIDAHEYGNGACIFTRDGKTARRFSDTLAVGMVGVNVALPVPAAYHSFGGWKRSMFGDLGAHGPDAMRFYTRRKTITQRWPSSSGREAVEYGFSPHR